jgi:peroxiredoxin Q/BCP
MLKINTKAPDFSLPDQNGKIHKLSDYKGKWILLYFYPKDNTTGCTIQACVLAEEFPSFKKLKIVVLGVSIDSVLSHKKFEGKYNLPFTLLSDEGKKVVRKYKVWAQKSMYGRKYMGTLRQSYLINPKGVIVKIYEKVKPLLHAEEVLTDLKKLQR